MADLLYSFLPRSGAKYTWREAAAEHGLEEFWGGGSKLPAITQLLEATFERRRGGVRTPPLWGSSFLYATPKNWKR